MNSSRSYIVSALIDWIVDNQCTPHIVVDARVEGVEVPTEYIVDGLITLNVSGHAIRNFKLGPDGLFFDARFGGVSRQVDCPVGSIVGVYAKENRQGMAFEVENADQAQATSGNNQSNGDKQDLPPYLRVVKE